MLFLENQRRLGRRVKHGCVVAGPCFALYSDEATWGRWDGLVRIRSASAVGALGPQHLGGVFLVENFVAVAAFKCLLDHGGLLFRRGDAFRTRRRSRVLPSTWKSAAALSGKCERPGRSGIGGLADVELGMRLAAWRAWRRRAACGLVAMWEMPGVRNAGCAGAALRSRCLGLGCAET